jgi:hypothetical protein
VNPAALKARTMYFMVTGSRGANGLPEIVGLEFVVSRTVAVPGSHFVEHVFVDSRRSLGAPLVRLRELGLVPPDWRPPASDQITLRDEEVEGLLVLSEAIELLKQNQ